MGGGRSDLPFIFLQPAGAGSRILTVPSVSSSFGWTAPQVAKLGPNKQSIYILAKEKLAADSEVRVNSLSNDWELAVVESFRLQWTCLLVTGYMYL